METAKKAADPQCTQETKAQEFKISGNDKYNKNNFKGAIVDYKLGLLHDPDNPDLHANLSAAYIGLQKYIEAEEHAVYTISLRPRFHKGYMRAAKAAHGKGMTRLALKRLNQGLSMICDPIGTKELKRLKTQYTSYLALPCNAAREMEFNSDECQSNDEEKDKDHVGSGDDDDESEITDDPPAPDSEMDETKVGEKLKDSSGKEEPTTTGRCEEEISVVPCGIEPSVKISKLKMLRKNHNKSRAKLKGCKIIPECLDSQRTVDLTTGASESSYLDKDVSLECDSLPENEPRRFLELCEELTKDTDLKTHVADKDMSLECDSLPESEPRRFLELCKELTKDPDLKTHVAEFKDLLKNGSEAFLTGNYRKAAQCYKAAKGRVGRKLSDYEIDDRQFNVIKYALCVALINHDTYDDVVKAIKGLTEMEVYRLSIPALYVLMARAYCKLNRFKSALEPLEKLQEIVENFLIFPAFSWPGTTETIEETTPAGLKNAIKELNQLCRMQHKPTATCRFDNCLKISSHIVPSELIYLSDPDFIGYVKMVCEEKCHIEFHISCWKAYKESVCGIGKINDKDFIGRRCLTTDCVNSSCEPSQITTIEIIGPDGQVKSVNKHDSKTSAETKKIKKKKSKIDDKEKLIKPKKSKEKKAAREVKKPATVSMEEEDESAEALRACADDPVKALESRKQALVELRALNFGLEDNYWNPQLKYYGRSDESIKTVLGQFLDPKEKKESDPDTDAKDFLFSYFLSILKDEGPLKQVDVEDIWKQSAGDFCDIKVVLPDLKNISEVLAESTCFCLIEDYICLAEQVEEAYKTVKTEVVETATFLLTGSAEAHDETQDEIQEEPHCSRSHQIDSGPIDGIKLHYSCSDDESEDGEENSGGESEESDEEMTEDEDKLPLSADTTIEERTEISPEPTIVPPKPLEDEKFSLHEMLDEMTRVKNMFMKTTDEEAFSVKKDEFGNNEERIRDKDECSSTETFESANSSSSMNMIATDEDKNNAMKEIDLVEVEECELAMKSEICIDDKVAEETVTDDILEQPSTSGDVEFLEFSNNLRHSIIALKCGSEGEDTFRAGEQDSVDKMNNDKGSQSEIKTEERQIQTSPMITTHKPSQTKESELFKDLNKKLHDFQNQILNLKKEIQRLNTDLCQREASVKHIKTTHETALTRMRDEHRSSLETQRNLTEKFKAQAAEKENELKQQYDKLLKSKEKVRDSYNALLVKYNQLKKELTSQQKSATETKEFLTTANATIKQLQSANKTFEKNIKTKVAKAQQFHLQSIKVYWEREINQLRKRCVEKISEMQSWFSMFPPKEVEDLPSWGTIRQTTMQWGEVSKTVQEIEADFQIKYNTMEMKLNRGEELDELNTLTLPKLPDEPKPLPLDRIHKEVTEKHLKKIGELTQLVVSQQLEIEKSKETNHQVQQLMNSFQMVPRIQTPMTTAFGSLALQYPYPQSSTTSFGQTAVPTIPPNQDPVTAGGAATILQADVQTLLKESSKAVSFTSALSEKSTVPEDVSFIGNFSNLSFTIPPEASPKPQTPPLVGVAHNLLKASVNLAEKKDTKSEERSRTQKQEPGLSSRESTPAPSVALTPDKPKKKKKNKSESKIDSSEVKVVFPVTHEPASVTNDDTNEDQDDWNVVVPKSAWMSKTTISTTAPLPDTKLKNKKKLLEKLLIKFSTTNLKEMDEIVKQLRDDNNGSLSGLSYDEIETRVERIITKRQFMKSTSLGLVKFSDAAWVAVNQDETVSWTNVQNEDCAICLESMGQDRTKINCNHEFHTQCLRKWLKEKSVCPLCNKFTTMPDEFPAL